MSASGIAKKSANVFKILTLGSFKPHDLLIFSSFNLFATDSLDTVGNDSVSLFINHFVLNNWKVLSQTYKETVDIQGVPKKAEC